MIKRNKIVKFVLTTFECQAKQIHSIVLYRALDYPFIKYLNMNLAFKKRKVNSYFRFMKNWDTESKKDLIKKLTKSINDKTDEKHDFSSCFGAWDDERSADEIINDIRNSRVNNREIEDF